MTAPTPLTHTITMTVDDSGDRTYWECDCGRSGSCTSYRVDIVAEEHLGEDDHVYYRYPAGGAR